MYWHQLYPVEVIPDLWWGYPTNPTPLIPYIIYYRKWENNEEKQQNHIIFALFSLMFLFFDAFKFFDDQQLIFDQKWKIKNASKNKNIDVNDEKSWKINKYDEYSLQKMTKNWNLQNVLKKPDYKKHFFLFVKLIFA